MENKVWYVSYGSNLLEERFRCYIEGGTLSFNGRVYKGCNDRTFPEESIPVEIPFTMYYSMDSRNWNGAVCFLDASAPGFSYGRAWQVTGEQLEQIHDQEGRSWYDLRLGLPQIQGLPAFTLTTSLPLPKKPVTCVGESYLKVLKLGLKETFPRLTDAQIEEYLKTR